MLNIPFLSGLSNQADFHYCHDVKKTGTFKHSVVSDMAVQHWLSFYVIGFVGTFLNLTAERGPVHSSQLQYNKIFRRHETRVVSGCPDSLLTRKYFKYKVC